MADAIAEDREAGLTPLAIAAVAGSTNTGSVDDVRAMADLSERESLWLHVDAAYGGAARLSQRDAHRVPGLERADSVTIDPHKWFFQAYDIGALIVRRREDLLTAFHRAPEYYRSNRPEDEPLHWYQYSMEGTRRFRGLKLWMSWKHLGTEGLGHLIEQNDDLAAYLAARCAEADDFEANPAVPELSVVCFRHLPDGWTRWPDAVLDDYQTRLQRALEVSGEAWVSTTVLRGHTYLRAGVVNYLSTSDDVDRLLDHPAGGLRRRPRRPRPAAERPGTSRTLATSKRTAPGLSRCVRRKVCPRARSFCRLRAVTASHPPPKPLPRRVLTSQNTRVSAAREDEVEFADAAAPVPGEHPIPTIAVVTSRGRFADGTGGRSLVGHRATVRAGSDRVSARSGDQWEASGIVVVSSRRASSSTLTSRRVMTRTLETNRAGRNMSHTQASIRSTWIQPPSMCWTSTLLAR